METILAFVDVIYQAIGGKHFPLIFVLVPLLSRLFSIKLGRKNLTSNEEATVFISSLAFIMFLNGIAKGFGINLSLFFLFGMVVLLFSLKSRYDRLP